ncbi:MAG: beta-lactamase family protein [Planctomycetes bacterium]|nr:beta-lactamase family protein [Planctomycetota bacterium]
MPRLLVLLILLPLLPAADPPVAPAWAAVDAAVRAHLAQAGRNAPDGLGLRVHGRDDRVVFQRMYGDMAADRPLAVASSSKLITALTVFAAISSSQGRLTLDSTTGRILGWKAPKADITLRHLLSFTSGLPADDRFMRNPQLTLAEAVDKAAALDPECPPGTRFRYGGTHMAVAGRMVEVVTGKSWNDYFRSAVADPLGLSDQARYYCTPRLRLGEANPMLGGGLNATMEDYGVLLGVVFHRGAAAGGRRLGDEELFDLQAKEPFVVAIGKTPMNRAGLPYHYGLGCWLETSTPQTGAAVISSAGTFGFTPWLDRENGYYAMLGMEDRPGSGSRFSVALQQQLKSLIAAAMAAR